MATVAEATKAERVLGALGDPTRRAMIAGLARGPATVSSLASVLGVTRTAVGQHIAILESCGLVETEKHGRVRTCRFNPDGLRPLQSWIDFHRTTWEASLDRLGAILLEDEA